MPPKSTIKDLNDKIDRLVCDNKAILEALNVMLRDMDHMYHYLDTLSFKVSDLTAAAEKVTDFYSKIKKQEQEIYWNWIKNNPS